MSDSEHRAGSGIAGLDRLLGGGLSRGNVFLIQGASGTGKTTLCLQFLIEGARHGERCLYLGTSETEQEIANAAASHGWSLDGITVKHHATPQYGARQTMLDPAEVELPHTIEVMLSLVAEYAPSRLVIDSLAEIRVLARDEFWYRRQLMLLKEHFADSPCTALLVEVPCAHQQPVNTLVSGVIGLEQTSPLYGPDRRRLRIAKMRGQHFSSGYHDYRIRTGGLEVFPRLIAAEHRRRFDHEQTSTGLVEMDTMLNGGLVRGTTTLLLGASGAGKSLMAAQLVVAAAERGERSAFYTFDERVQTLFQRVEKIAMPLERHAGEGTVQVQQVDPAELTAGEFSDRVRQLVEDEGIRWLVIDSLNGYAHAMPDERALSVHLHELSSYLSQQGVGAVYTLTQHGLIFTQVDQPFAVSYIADAVILFRPFEYAGRVRKAVSVYKSRSGAHETSIRELEVGSGGLRLGEQLRCFQGVISGTPVYLGDTQDAGH
jgi:circadian clock protein KaiC